MQENNKNECFTIRIAKREEVVAALGTDFVVADGEEEDGQCWAFNDVERHMYYDGMMITDEVNVQQAVDIMKQKIANIFTA